MIDTDSFYLIEESLAKPEPVDIEKLIGEFGIDLIKDKNLPDEISGEIKKIRDNKFQITVNANHGEFRQRFTMAHELAHYIFHRHLLDSSQPHQDNKLYRKKDDQQAKISDPHEIQANNFAASCLMPDRHILQDFDLMGGNIIKMANKWKVSKQAMEIKLKTLRRFTK
jgi:Zn-dependent peptidase ImmA (M78 family)